MRITITCEECGKRHRLERAVRDAGPIWIVCHGCELPLRAVLELAAGDESSTDSFRAAWSNTIDLSHTQPANS